jgi:hypothetical protein
MSREDRQRHLRQLVCEGCSRHCRYADFRAVGKYAGGFAPKYKRSREQAREADRRWRERKRGIEIPHGNCKSEQTKPHAGQAFFKEEAAVVAIVRRQREQRGFRKTYVLGSLHHAKMILWLEYTRSCPCQMI